jgi:hypothetical protein
MLFGLNKSIIFRLFYYNFNIEYNQVLIKKTLKVNSAFHYPYECIEVNDQ